MPVIEFRKTTKTYRTGELDVHALRETNLEIEEGEFAAIMGPSGSGKSTVLNLLGLLDQPTTGDYLLAGTNVAQLNDDRLSAIRCKQIGMIFQSFNLFSGYTVLENVCVPMRYAEVEEAAMIDRAERILKDVGLTDRTHHRPTQLSGGQCQRVAIARALANEPAVLLADEPTGNLDEATGNEILDLFKELHSRGHTIIMVTHNPLYSEEVQRVIRLKDGRVIEDTRCA